MSIEIISSFFAHPFILLITGASISSVLVTVLTQKWQNKKRRFEVQISLINDIAEAVILMSSTLNSRSQGTVDIEKQESSIIKIKKIEATLHAYFPKDKLSEEWKEYTDYTMLLWHDPTKAKSKEEDDKIKKIIEKHIQPYVTKRFPNVKINWDKILKDNDVGEWSTARNIMMTYYPYFVKKITKSNTMISL
mgnify:CR=1 FL=1